MQLRLPKPYALICALVAACYLAGYPLLWTKRVESMFALQSNGICIESSREVIALRFDWLARSPLRVPLAVIYAPINNLRRPQSTWQRND